MIYHLSLKKRHLQSIKFYLQRDCEAEPVGCADAQNKRNDVESPRGERGFESWSPTPPTRKTNRYNVQSPQNKRDEFSSRICNSKILREMSDDIRGLVSIFWPAVVKFLDLKMQCSHHRSWTNWLGSQSFVFFFSFTLLLVLFWGAYAFKWLCFHHAVYEKWGKP